EARAARFQFDVSLEVIAPLGRGEAGQSFRGDLVKVLAEDRVHLGARLLYAHAKFEPRHHVQPPRVAVVHDLAARDHLRRHPNRPPEVCGAAYFYAEESRRRDTYDGEGEIIVGVAPPRFFGKEVGGA